MRWSCARRASSVAAAGSGITPVMGSTSSGLVPQETMGTISSARSATSLSNTAPASLGSVFHQAMAHVALKRAGVALGKADFDGIHDYPPGFSFG